MLHQLVWSEQGLVKRVYYRWLFVMVIWCILLGILLLRLGDLVLVHRDFLLRQSEARTLRVVPMPAYRGMITDRNGVPMAISAPVETIWVNPQLFAATTEQMQQLASLLHVSVSALQTKIRDAATDSKSFLFLQRQMAPESAQQVMNLHLLGVYHQREYRRYYPLGAIDAHVIGFTNVDHHGQEGTELAFDQWLAGESGAKKVLKDRLGHVVAEVSVQREPKQGHTLVLSIDQRIQYAAYQALSEAVQTYQAESGSAVVMDVNTGEILAMVNQPTYNPNERPIAHSERMRNRAITDVFEPGSTIKAFSVAFALASKHYHPNTLIDTNPGWIVIDGHTIKDTGKNNGVITLTELLEKSSSVGAAKVMLSLSPQQYWKLLWDFGFSQNPGSGFPGEAAGTLVSHRLWSKIDTATLAFGYGLSASTLQIARAYAALALGGELKPVSLLKLDAAPKGEQVMDAVISKTVLHMLESVVQQRGGTGKLAAIPGYRIAGKTGTAYIAGEHGYDKKRYIASFVGIAPVSHPRLVAAVILREPQHQHKGGQVAAPAFAKIMSQSLRILDVAPDAVQPRE